MYTMPKCTLLVQRTFIFCASVHFVIASFYYTYQGVLPKCTPQFYKSLLYQAMGLWQSRMVGIVIWCSAKMYTIPGCKKKKTKLLLLPGCDDKQEYTKKSIMGFILVILQKRKMTKCISEDSKVYNNQIRLVEMDNNQIRLVEMDVVYHESGDSDSQSISNGSKTKKITKDQYEVGVKATSHTKAECLHCHKMVGKRRYDEHMQKCNLYGFLPIKAAQGAARKQYLYRCTQGGCTWQGRKFQAKKHQTKVHGDKKPITLSVTAPSIRPTQIKINLGKSVINVEEDNVAFSEDEFDIELPPQDAKMKAIVSSCLLRAYGKLTEGKWSQARKNRTLSQLRERITTAFPWTSNQPFATMRNRIIRQFASPLVGEENVMVLLDFEQLLATHQQSNQLLISSSINLRAMSARINSLNVEHFARKKVAPGWNKSRKRLYNLTQHRKTLLKPNKARSAEFIQQRLDQNAEKIIALTNRLQRVDSSYRRMVLFKVEDAPSMSKRNTYARKQQAFNYVYQRLTDCLCSLALCSDRVLAGYALKQNPSMQWQYLNSAYFQLPQMAQWFPLTKTFLQHTKQYTYQQYLQIRQMFTRSRQSLPIYENKEDFLEPYYTWLASKKLVHLYSNDPNSQRYDNQFVMRNEQLWVQIHAAVDQKLEQLHERLMNPRAFSFDRVIEPQVPEPRPPTKTILPIVIQMEAQPIEQDKWEHFDLQRRQMPNVPFSAAFVCHRKVVKKGIACLVCNNWIDQGVSCIDCAAAFHEECRPRVCPYIEKVPFFKLMNHPTMAQAFTVGSMGPIQVKRKTKPQLYFCTLPTPLRISKEEWLNSSGISHPERYSTQSLYHRDCKFFPGYVPSGRYPMAFDEKDQTALQDFKKNTYPPIYIKSMPIKERGACAIRSIRQAEIIGMYTGKIQPVASYTHLSQSESITVPYVFNLATGPGTASELCIVSSDDQPFGCMMYLNHASKGNIKAIIGYHRRQLVIVLYAAQRIEKDEELLLNYNAEDKTFPIHWQEEEVEVQKVKPALPEGFKKLPWNT